MRFIFPLVVKILASAAFGGVGSKVPAEVNWSIVNFASEELEVGVGGPCTKMVSNVENFTKQVIYIC